jgi:hypothetical protein
MPCSQCNSPTHNRRNGSCPVNIARNNGTRPPAELRPRSSHESPRSREQMLEDYLLLYRNIRPIRMYQTSNNSVYNVYYLLPTPRLNETAQTIFMRQNTTNITARRVRGIVVGLAVCDDHGEYRILSGEPLPPNARLYIFIPQIPGFNVVEQSLPSANHKKRRLLEYIHSIHISMENSSLISDAHDETIETNETIKDDESRERCSICFETAKMRQQAHLGCGHSFCVSCIKQLMVTYKRKYMESHGLESQTHKMGCPLCRRDITKFVFSDTDERRAMIEYIDKDICEL